MITRSDLVHRAAEKVPSRFELVQATARAARKIHPSRTRMGDTINTVLLRIAEAPGCVIDYTPSHPPELLELLSGGLS